MKRRVVILAGSVLLLLSGCGGEPNSTPLAVTRDSAGITIVENSEPSWSEAEAWRLSDEPALRIGQIEGEAAYQLFQVSDAVRLSDGRIVVANRGTHELRYYDGTGIHLMTVGGQGGGPGEFQMLSSVDALAGDSVMAYDIRHRRISFFDSQGGHVRDLSLAGREQTLFARLEGRFADGTYLAQMDSRQPMELLNRPMGRQRDSLIAFRYDSDGGVLDTLGIFPSIVMQTSTVSMGGQEIPLPMPVPFSAMTVIAVGADRAYVGTSDTYEIRALAESGRLLSLIRKAHTGRPVTEEDIEASREAMTEASAALESNPFADQIRAALENIEYSETMPAYNGLRVDAAGNLWVTEVRGANDSIAHRTVFNPDGVMLGEVAFSADFRVTDIGSDYVLGTTSDEMDIEYVLLYELIKPVR